MDLQLWLWSRNIFYDRFPHVIFILKERTQRHYFCDQDQTLDIFAGARAEDSAIMMVANIRRARHSLLKLFQRDDGPFFLKLNLIIKKLHISIALYKLWNKCNKNNTNHINKIIVFCIFALNNKKSEINFIFEGWKSYIMWTGIPISLTLNLTI